MHDAAWEWVADSVPLIPDLPSAHVLEVGSYDVNGSVRPLFDGCRSYFGVDIRDGPGVDLVADASTWYDGRRWDVVVCTEVLEHTRWWRQIVRTCCLQAASGALIVVTCATVGRKPHAADGAEVLHRHEWYENIPADQLVVELGRYCTSVDVDVADTDLRARAWR